MIKNKILSNNDQLIGRFDRSFLIHMVKEFFLILLIVTALEFSLKAALVYYKFRTENVTNVERVANEIADDIRLIMRNRGGPVAAQTFYPILKRNWNDLGFEVAILPSKNTVISMIDQFNFEPMGIPIGEWPDTQHQSTKVEIRAEEFCLACHKLAEKGDVLGEVIVRSYLARDFAKWWLHVKLSSGLALAKIVLHSILLFLLLRVRMEPLLRLRSVVSNLSKAYAGLHLRAEIRTPDEFGILARDLNLFLDRITRLVTELDGILDSVVRVNDDIITMQANLRDHAETVVAQTRNLERRSVLLTKRNSSLSAASIDAIKIMIADLNRAQDQMVDRELSENIIAEINVIIGNAESQRNTNGELYLELSELGAETQQFQTAIAEMVRLEERMKGIIGTGTALVHRLQTKE